MKHNKWTYALTALLTAPLLLAACGSDDVTANPSEADMWLHPYSASTADQALQTQFYQQNGIYLLFNDTLRKQQVATNPDGTPFYDYETADLSFLMTGYSDNYTEVFQYDYLQTDAEKRAATTFVQDKVLPHLGGSLLPFSLLLVNKINFWVQNAGTYGSTLLQNPTVYAGYRCTAIVTEGVDQMGDAEQTAYCNEILKAIVNAKLGALPASTFDEFYSYCNQYYSTYDMYDAAEAFFETYPQPMDIGLLDNNVSYYAWGNPYGFYMYNIAASSYDLQDYTNAVFTYTDEEFQQKYADYPICLRKFQLLKEIYSSLGIKF